MLPSQRLVEHDGPLLTVGPSCLQAIACDRSADAVVGTADQHSGLGQREAGLPRLDHLVELTQCPPVAVPSSGIGSGALRTYVPVPALGSDDTLGVIGTVLTLAAGHARRRPATVVSLCSEALPGQQPTAL